MHRTLSCNVLQLLAGTLIHMKLRQMARVFWWSLCLTLNPKPGFYGDLASGKSWLYCDGC